MNKSLNKNDLWKQRRENQWNLLGDFMSSLNLAQYTSKKQSVTIIKFYKSISNELKYRKNL